MRFLLLALLLALSLPTSAQIIEQPLGWEALYDGVNSYPVIADREAYTAQDTDLLAIQVDGEIALFRFDRAGDEPFVDGSEGGILAAEITTERCLENTYAFGVPCTPVPVAPPMLVLLPYHNLDEVPSFFWEAAGTTYGLTTTPFRIAAVDRSGPTPVTRPTLGIFETYANPLDTTTHARLLDASISKRLIMEGPYTGTVPEPGMVYTVPIGAVFVAGIAGLAFARRRSE